MATVNGILNMVAGNAYAGEVEPAKSQASSKTKTSAGKMGVSDNQVVKPHSRQRFSLPSVLPESHPNAVIDSAYKVGRAIERARDGVTDIVLHPVDAVKEFGTLVWDSAGYVSDKTFGLSTEGSRQRNQERGTALNFMYDRFTQGNVSTKLEMVTEVATSLILGAAATAPLSLVRVGAPLTVTSAPKTFTPAFNEIKAFSTKSALEGELYPENVSSPNLRVTNTNTAVASSYNISNSQFGQHAWQNFRNCQQTQIKITGGRSIGDEIAIRDHISAELYSEIRNSTHDIRKISKNLDIPEFQVRRVKEHIFYNTHQLDYGLGVSRFHPDLEIAHAWKRLEAGTHIESDLLIFRHEHFESRFEGIFRTDYSTAHDAANRAGRSSGLKNEFDIKEVKHGNI